MAFRHNDTRSNGEQQSSLDIYLSEIGSSALLTEQEEAELSAKILGGSRAALNKLVSANLRFVVSEAKQFAGRGVEIEDLINEGNIGLMRAAEIFDATKGHRFVSFAQSYVRRAMNKAVAEQAMVMRVASADTNSLGKINRAIAQFEQRHQRRPSAMEIADMLGWTVERVENAMMGQVSARSIDAPIRRGSDNSLLDLISNYGINTSNKSVMDENFPAGIAYMLRCLDDRQREVIKRLFGLGCERETMADAGNSMGLKRERVRQIRNVAMRRLRKLSEQALRQTYL